MISIIHDSYPNSHDLSYVTLFNNKVEVKFGVCIKGLKLRQNSDWTGNWIGAAPGPRLPLPRRRRRGRWGTQILLTLSCTPPRLPQRRSRRAPGYKYTKIL